MKAVIIICIALAVFALLFPIIYTLSLSGGSVPPLQEDVPSEDASVTVTVLDGDKTVSMNMRDYLTGVVAAEMPASFELEALKAQAVAARTYTLYKMLVNPSSNHPDADVCTDSSCCKAYSSDQELQEKLGDSYEEYISKIKSAVNGTDGQCLVYDGEPILAVFHSSSSGKTVSSGEIWPSQLPYLVSVDTPETDDTVPNLTETVSFTFDEFKNTVSASYPEASFPEDISGWITDIAESNSGRLSSVNIGGVTLTGSQVRSLFSLRSAAISFSVTDSGIDITTNGYGHGVGMSQYGAQLMAKGGSTYDQILLSYYTGAVLDDMGKYL